MSAPAFSKFDLSGLEAAELLPANDRAPDVIVGGLRTVRLSRDELAARMVADCLAARQRPGTIAKTVFAANGHAIALAAVNPVFRQQFENADIVHADGQALVFASRLLTTTAIAERSATTDFIHDAARASIAHGLRLFLFGATEEVNRRCAERLAEVYPDLKIVGRRHGYFSRDEEDSICDEINRSGADVVWVGLGVPLEYLFATRNKHRLNAGWIVTCGGCFNYITGDYSRAPDWMQRAGLEWLYRVATDPKRLLVRYAVTNPVALVMLLLRTVESGQGAAVSLYAAARVPAKIPAPRQFGRA
jgi:N-acetylglucosaminyldiphosphoundecaprenol N-acetyl-beta-D-mannosaminyltransferase